MIRGTPQFDGIAAGEVSMNFMGASFRMTAKAAFVNSKTGQTHGWTTHETWSPAIIEKVKELRALLEAEIAQSHFSDVDGARTPGIKFTKESEPPAGLGEHLSANAEPL